MCGDQVHIQTSIQSAAVDEDFWSNQLSVTDSWQIEKLWTGRRWCPYCRCFCCISLKWYQKMEFPIRIWHLLMLFLCWWWALEGSLRVWMINSAVFLRWHKCIDWIGRAGLGRGWCWMSLSDLFSNVTVFVVSVEQGVITHRTAQEGPSIWLYKAIYMIINQ